MRAFLNLGLDEFVANTEAATRQRVLYQMIESGNLASERKITAVSESLRKRRTVGGWVRDVSGNLLVNLVTIFILGALLLGYRFSAELQQGVEKKTGINGPIASDNQTTIERAKPTGPATTPSSTNP